MAAAEASEAESKYAVAAFRLLLLTGCRLSEIQKLEWRFVYLEEHELRLPDKHLPNGGKILEVRGIPGISADRDVHEAIHETLDKTGKKWDIIEVYGKWDDPTAQKVTADAIAVHGHFERC